MTNLSIHALRQQVIADPAAAALLTAQAARSPFYSLSLARLWVDPHALAGVLYVAKKIPDAASVRRHILAEDRQHSDALAELDADGKRRRERESEVARLMRTPAALHEIQIAAQRLHQKEEK